MKLFRKLSLQLVLLLSFSVITVQSQAQSDPSGDSPVTTTFALKNATVITQPGNEITGATIVIKNGLIQSVGKNVQIPADAEEIDASDMYIYAAFIDGMSNAGAKRPENPERPRDLFTPDPPNEYAGITPEKSVIEQLDISSNDFDGMRKAGFGLSHVVPYGRMLPGSGALVLMGSGEHIDEIILEKDKALFAQWVGAPGAYPGNILGIMAKWRNLYRNAEYRKAHVEMYAQNPSGLQRPEKDRVSEAFFPVISQQKPVMFDVDGMLDVRRAMRLQNDLGFPLIVAGVEEAWDLVDDFKNSGTPVFLSLDLPDEPKEIKEDDKTAEVDALEKRRMEFYKKHVEQYGMLANAGINFGFSTAGTRTNNILENVRKLIENGLSEDQALAALTTNPANILGLSNQFGTISNGKVANLIVSTDPIFSKDANIKMMFVDGNKFEYEVKGKTAKKDAQPAAEGGDVLVGSWTYNMNTPGEPQSGKMVITMENGTYGGYLTSSDGSPDNTMNNINFRNGELTFDFSIDAGGQSVLIVVEGIVTGTTYEAEARVDAFNVSLELTATKDEK